MEIKLLDCTLRDGAHVNGGDFGEKSIKNVISGLNEANVDIIEMGFLKETNFDSNISFYPTIEKAYDFLPVFHSPKTEFSLMARADQYAVSNLSECNGQINIIRIAFYYDYLEKTIEYANEVKKRGYKIALNLINTPGNSLEDLERVIDYSNKIRPETLTIVDTFGVLDKNSLSDISGKYDKYLDKNINIGLHVHENKASGFALAQDFIESMREKRNIILDSSLMGIGRAPGNLCSELIADYLNVHFGKEIEMRNIYSLIQEEIYPIKQKCRWGYSPEFFISAKYKVHRSYAEHLAKKGLGLKEIDIILSQIERPYDLKFNLNYVEEIVKKEGETL